MFISMQDELVVYTVVMGENRKVPRAMTVKGVRWVIVSDIPGLRAPGWETMVSKRTLKFDSPRSSRHPKMMPFEYFPSHSRSLYIDSNIRLTADPRKLWEFLIGSADECDFGAAFQSFRPTLDDEFQAVRDLRLDTPASIEELYSLYLNHYRDALNHRVTWGGILARRHGVSSLENAMRDWFFLTLRTSRRDQLTLPIVLVDNPDLRFRRVNLDNRASNFHRWPASRVPKSTTYRQFQFPDREPTAKVQTSENLLAREVARLRESETAALKQLEGVYQSRSWRAVQFASRVAGHLRLLHFLKKS